MLNIHKSDINPFHATGLLSYPKLFQNTRKTSGMTWVNPCNTNASIVRHYFTSFYIMRKMVLWQREFSLDYVIFLLDYVIFLNGYYYLEKSKRTYLSRFRKHNIKVKKAPIIQPTTNAITMNTIVFVLFVIPKP